MNILWTLFGTFLALVLAVGGIILFEVAARPSSEQRGMVGSAAFVAFAAVSLGLWVWHFKTGKPKKKARSKRKVEESDQATR